LTPRTEESYLYGAKQYVLCRNKPAGGCGDRDLIRRAQSRQPRLGYSLNEVAAYFGKDVATRGDIARKNGRAGAVG
jgi:hypothetical protein